MAIRAAFEETEITPPLGTKKIGWIKEIVIDHLLDPIFARLAVLETPDSALAFLHLDLLCIQESDVTEIRRRIEERFGFPGTALMISTTHNHAGPAVAGLGEVPRDAPYVEEMTRKIVDLFGRALSRLQPARIGFASVQEWHVSHNRRMVMRDGTVRTHSGYGSPDALYVEGPIDPELGLLAAQDRDGRLLGAIVNFGCHPTHHGGDTALSAGFPGALDREMKARGCPMTLFLNGAAGNLSPGDPLSNLDDSMEALGTRLAEATERSLDQVQWHDDLRLEARGRTVGLPHRTVTEDEIRGTTRGAQRFIDPTLYDSAMPDLVEWIRKEPIYPAEVQVFTLDGKTAPRAPSASSQSDSGAGTFPDGHAFVSVPAELFVQLGLRIKERSASRRTWVVGFTNGYAGYVPHREAFERGGYETTFSWGSHLAHDAGDRLVEAALGLLSAP